MGKKKVKKVATKTLNLNEFLASNTSGAYQAPGSGIGGVDDYIPTAPRASLGGSLIDIEDLPRNPPFQAFVGNLPFEVEEVDLEEFFNEKGAKVLKVSLKRDTDTGRLRGTGFLEYETRQDLKVALECTGAMFNSRAIRIELPGGLGGRDGDRYGDRGGGYDRDGPLRSEEVDSWRTGAATEGLISRGASGGGSRSGGFGGDRYGDRGDRGGDRYGDRGDRGGDRYGDRGGDRYGDRGGEPARAGGFDDRSGGDWRSAPRESAPSARSDGFGERGSRGGFGADRGGFGADRGGFGDRGGDRDSFVRRDDGPPAAERPRLMLAKRSVPVGEPSPSEGVSPGKSNPFGAARPVDTAAKLNAAVVETSKLSARPSSGPRADSFGGVRPVDTIAQGLATVTMSESPQAVGAPGDDGTAAPEA